LAPGGWGGDWCPQLLATADPIALLRHYYEALATESGMDPDAIWEWEYLERVSAGRYALSPGADDLARPLLTTAEAFPDNGPRSALSSARTRAYG